MLLVILIPQSAVNLADYFVVRRGRYDVASFFTADSAYGGFAWRGLLAYTVGIAAEWPFVSQPDCTGPVVPALGGVDISQLIGWFAAAAAYLLLAALTPEYHRWAAWVCRCAQEACSVRIFPSAGQHLAPAWCGIRTDHGTLPGPGAIYSWRNASRP